MTTQNDSDTAAARARLYLERAQIGQVFARTLAFYSGAPTEPTSFTGNLVLGTHSGGVGAALIDGIGPPIEEVVPCDEPDIFDISVVFGADNVFVTVTYENQLPDDVYILFNTTTGQSFGAVSFMQTPPTVLITFPDNDDLPPGLYSLKILRADNADCFAVRKGIFIIAAPVVCTINIAGWSGDGIFPNPFLNPGDTDLTVAVTGTGFLNGPLTVTIFPVLFATNNLNIDSVIVADDNNLTVQFDADPVETGTYAIRIELTADPSCFDEYGTVFLEDVVVVAVI